MEVKLQTCRESLKEQGPKSGEVSNRGVLKTGDLCAGISNVWWVVIMSIAIVAFSGSNG